jgi:arabinose-5-phosphate isomerase
MNKNIKSSNFFASAKKTFKEEITSLSELSKTLDKNKFNEICNEIIKCKGNLVLMGIGKSGNIAAKVSSTLSSTGCPSFYLSAAEASHGDLGSLKKKDLLVVLSFSGETEEVLKIFNSCKNKVNKIISITGNKNSTIAREADHHLLLNIRKEACPLNLAPTSSSTAMLLVGDAIAIALLEAKKFTKEDFALNHPGGKLGKSLLKVKDIMINKNLSPIVHEKSKLKEVIYEVSKKGLGLTLIKNSKNKVCGIFTDGDLRRALNLDLDIKTVEIKEIMTKKYCFVIEDSSVKDAVLNMEKNKIYALVVKNNKKEITGILRMHDIIEAKII